MVTLLLEGRFDIVIGAPNREVDHNLNHTFRTPNSESELPAIWTDTSNAIQEFKGHSMTRMVLDKVLRLELSKLGPLLKMRPGVVVDQELVQQLANKLQLKDYIRNAGETMARRNATSTEEDLRALALRTKPHKKPWL